MDIDLEGISLAYDACARMDAEPPPNDGELYCNVTWDDWGCWNYTKAGTIAHMPCPWYIKGFDPSLSAWKECEMTGEWKFYKEKNNTWSNYTRCINLQEIERDKQVIYMFVTGYSLSIFALLISLAIFFHFKQLQCDRITLHKNLFISYILNGLAWIPYYIEASMKPETIAYNPVWCQVLHVITQYFLTSNFFWMFCEGLYLHTIIVVAFLSGRKLVISCYVIGWGIPVVTTAVYSIIRGLDPQASQDCWLQDSNLMWIIFGPIIATLLTNVVFLCNIVRVLITKMRAVSNPDTNQTRKAVRATVILIPLLGLQFILFPFAPKKDDKVLYNLYRMGSAFVTSFQGFFVALIFCFLNGEVITVIKRKWEQHQLMRGKLYGRSKYMAQTAYSMTDHTHYRLSSPQHNVDDTHYTLTEHTHHKGEPPQNGKRLLDEHC